MTRAIAGFRLKTMLSPWPTRSKSRPMSAVSCPSATNLRPCTHTQAERGWINPRTELRRIASLDWQLKRNERINYGPHEEIFPRYGAQANSPLRVVTTGSVLEHTSHGVRAVLCRRSVLSALRHYAVPIQRLADIARSWDGWPLPERNIGTNGDGHTRYVAAAGSHGKGRMGSARTGRG